MKAGYLMVGISEDGREVIINHPDLQPDANGCGHIVFSPDEARALAALLIEKADDCERLALGNEMASKIVQHTGIEVAFCPRHGIVKAPHACDTED